MQNNISNYNTLDHSVLLNPVYAMSIQEYTYGRIDPNLSIECQNVTFAFIGTSSPCPHQFHMPCSKESLRNLHNIRLHLKKMIGMRGSGGEH